MVTLQNPLTGVSISWLNVEHLTHWSPLLLPRLVRNCNRLPSRENENGSTLIATNVKRYEKRRDVGSFEKTSICHLTWVGERAIVLVDVPGCWCTQPSLIALEDRIWSRLMRRRCRGGNNLAFRSERRWSRVPLAACCSCELLDLYGSAYDWT